MEKVLTESRFEVDPSEMIRFKTMKRIEFIGSDSERIEHRLKQLESEWPIEKILQSKAAFLMTWGTVMGLTRSRIWFALPLVAAGLLFQHAVQGNSPDFRLLRRLGFRTQHEIDDERMVLKGLRGDFQKLNELSASDAMETVRN